MAIVNGVWNCIGCYATLVIDTGIYLSHIFGMLYFKSRDLEDNMLNVELNVTYLSEFRKKLTRLKLGIILSYLSLVVFFFSYSPIRVYCSMVVFNAILTH